MRTVVAPSFSQLSFGQVSAAAAGQVLFDQSNFLQQGGLPASPVTLTAPINVGGGVNGTTKRALICCVYFSNDSAGTVSAVSVTWNGTNMPSIGSYTGGGNSDFFIFGMVAPATGSNNIIVTHAGSNVNFDIALLSVVGADQTGSTTTFHDFTQNTGTSTTSSVTVPSAAGEIVFAAYESLSTYTTPSGTDIGRDNTFNVSAAAANWDVGSVSTLMTYSGGPSPFVALGFGIKAG